MTRRMLRRPQVQEMLSIGKNTLTRWIQTGHFPRPVRLGPRAVGWPVEQVEGWLANRAPTVPGQRAPVEAADGRAEALEAALRQRVAEAEGCRARDVRVNVDPVTQRVKVAVNAGAGAHR